MKDNNTNTANQPAGSTACGKPETKQPGLKRQLSPMHVWAIAFGCIVGWGAFVNPGKKFLPNSGVYGTAIAMVLGALVMFIIAYSYAYMVPRNPRAGGEFNFTRKAFGRTAAYICGWFLVAAYLTNVPMNSTAIGLIVDGLDGPLDLLKWGFHYSVAGFDVWAGEAVFASAILILFGWLNIIGVRKAGFIQTVLTSLLAVSVFTLTIAAIFSPAAQWANIQMPWGFDRAAALDALKASASTATGLSGAAANGLSDAATSVTASQGLSAFAKTGPTGILAAIMATFAIAPWAFVGFETIPQVAEEFKFKHSKVMLIMGIAILFGTFVYIANNTVAALAVNNWPERVMAGEWVLLVAAEEMLGGFGKVLLGIAVSCAVLSGIMGFYLASSRLMYAMARDGYLPKFFGKISPKYGTPVNAMLFCIIISLSGPVLGREALGWFVDMSAVGASIGFFFTCASTVVSMNWDPQCTYGNKLLAALGCILSFSFIQLQLLPIEGLKGVHFCKQSYLMFVIWCVIGIIFFIKQRKHFLTSQED